MRFARTGEVNMQILLKGGRVVDAVNGVDEKLDILIDGERIAKVGKSIEAHSGCEVVDCGGLTVIPGICDMHVHLRDPGQTHKEDVYTACEAAAAGGVTAVACMPNTNPSVDTPETVNYILEKAKTAKAKVYPVGAITKGLKGEEFTDFAALKAAGCVAVSDDGRPVKNARMMKQAIADSVKNGMFVTSHCEDLDIIDGGIINDGKVAKELGVKGMARSSENLITAREILLASELDLPIHIAHVSTKEAVKIIRFAKKNGVKVTCETAPHYFMLTEDKLRAKDADYRMNPPLREQEDVEAITAGVLDGTIDCIVTDHAPHAAEEKADFLKAPNGVVGLETSFAASFTTLVGTGLMSLSRLVEIMCVNPRKILGVEGGSLAEGDVADIAVVNTEESWTVQPEKLHSRSKNTCFKGMTLTGKVKYTFKDGKMVFKD